MKKLDLLNFIDTKEFDNINWEDITKTNINPMVNMDKLNFNDIKIIALLNQNNISINNYLKDMLLNLKELETESYINSIYFIMNFIWSPLINLFKYKQFNKYSYNFNLKILKHIKNNNQFDLISNLKDYDQNNNSTNLNLNKVFNFVNLLINTKIIENNLQSKIIKILIDLRVINDFLLSNLFIHSDNILYFQKIFILLINKINDFKNIIQDFKLLDLNDNKKLDTKTFNFYFNTDKFRDTYEPIIGIENKNLVKKMFINLLSASDKNNEKSLFSVLKIKEFILKIINKLIHLKGFNSINNTYDINEILFKIVISNNYLYNENIINLFNKIFYFLNTNIAKPITINIRENINNMNYNNYFNTIYDFNLTDKRHFLRNIKIFEEFLENEIIYNNYNYNSNIKFTIDIIKNILNYKLHLKKKDKYIKKIIFNVFNKNQNLVNWIEFITSNNFKILANEYVFTLIESILNNMENFKDIMFIEEIFLKTIIKLFRILQLKLIENNDKTIEILSKYFKILNFFIEKNTSKYNYIYDDYKDKSIIKSFYNFEKIFNSVEKFILENKFFWDVYFKSLLLEVNEFNNNFIFNIENFILTFIKTFSFNLFTNSFIWLKLYNLKKYNFLINKNSNLYIIFYYYYAQLRIIISKYKFNLLINDNKEKDLYYYKLKTIIKKNIQNNNKQKNSILISDIMGKYFKYILQKEKIKNIWIIKIFKLFLSQEINFKLKNKNFENIIKKLFEKKERNKFNEIIKNKKEKCMNYLIKNFKIKQLDTSNFKEINSILYHFDNDKSKKIDKTIEKYTNVIDKMYSLDVNVYYIFNKLISNKIIKNSIDSVINEMNPEIITFIQYNINYFHEYKDDLKEIIKNSENVINKQANRNINKTYKIVKINNYFNVSYKLDLNFFKIFCEKLLFEINLNNKWKNNIEFWISLEMLIKIINKTGQTSIFQNGFYDILNKSFNKIKKDSMDKLIDFFISEYFNILLDINQKKSYFYMKVIKLNILIKFLTSLIDINFENMKNYFFKNNYLDILKKFFEYWVFDFNILDIKKYPSDLFINFFNFIIKLINKSLPNLEKIFSKELFIKLILNLSKNNYNNEIYLNINKNILNKLTLVFIKKLIFNNNLIFIKTFENFFNFNKFNQDILKYTIFIYSHIINNTKHYNNLNVLEKFKILKRFNNLSRKQLKTLIILNDKKFNWVIGVDIIIFYKYIKSKIKDISYKIDQFLNFNNKSLAKVNYNKFLFNFKKLNLILGNKKLSYFQKNEEMKAYFDNFENYLIIKNSYAILNYLQEIEIVDNSGKIILFNFPKDKSINYLDNYYKYEIFEQFDLKDRNYRLVQLFKILPEIENFVKLQKKYIKNSRINEFFSNSLFFKYMKIICILFNIGMNIYIIFINNLNIRFRFNFNSIDFILLLFYNFLFLMLYVFWVFFRGILYYKVFNIKKKNKKFKHFLKSFILNQNTLFFLFNLIVGLLSLFYNFIIAFGIISIFFISNSLKFFLNALYKNLMKILITIFLMFIFINIFASIFNNYYKNNFIPSDFESYCSTPISCIYNIIYTDLKGDLFSNYFIKNPNPNWEYYLFFISNLIFFLIINIVLFYIITGLIIDTFAELREVSNERKYYKNNYCFICNLDKSELSKNQINIKNHIENTHNIWKYIDLIIYINSNKEKTKNIELQIKNKLKNNDFSFIPFENSLDINQTTSNYYKKNNLKQKLIQKLKEKTNKFSEMSSHLSYLIDTNPLESFQYIKDNKKVLNKLISNKNKNKNKYLNLFFNYENLRDDDISFQKELYNEFNKKDNKEEYKLSENFVIKHVNLSDKNNYSIKKLPVDIEYYGYIKPKDFKNHKYSLYNVINESTINAKNKDLIEYLNNNTKNYGKDKIYIDFNDKGDFFSYPDKWGIIEDKHMQILKYEINNLYLLGPSEITIKIKNFIKFYKIEKDIWEELEKTLGYKSFVSIYKQFYNNDNHNDEEKNIFKLVLINFRFYKRVKYLKSDYQIKEDLLIINEIEKIEDKIYDILYDFLHTDYIQFKIYLNSLDKLLGKITDIIKKKGYYK